MDSEDFESVLDKDKNVVKVKKEKADSDDVEDEIVSAIKKKVDADEKTKDVDVDSLKELRKKFPTSDKKDKKKKKSKKSKKAKKAKKADADSDED